MASRLVQKVERGQEAAGGHAGHKPLFDYWCSKLVDGRLPARSDIDPSEIPRDVLSSIYLVAVERKSGAAELAYWYRLVGTNVVRTAGRDITGMTIEEAYPCPEDLAAQRRAYGRVVMSAKPVSDQFPMRAPGKQHIVVSRLLLPLASDGSTVDMLLGMSVYGFRSNMR